MSSLRSLWTRLTAPRSTDEDEARREYMTKVMLTIVSMMSFVAALLSVISWGAGAFGLDILGEIMLMIGVLLGSWYLAQRGYWRQGSYILLALLFFESLYTNWVEGPGTSAMLYYVLMMLLTSILYGPKAQWIVSGVSLVAYLGIGWAHALGYPPTAPIPRTEFTIWALNVGLMLTIISLLQWFAAGQFRRAISQSRTSAVGLAEQVAERRRAEEALQRKAYYQELLIETSHHLTASLDVKDVLYRIADRAKRILDAYGCAIYLLEADGRTLTPVVAIEPPYEKEILATPIDVENSYTGRAVQARKGLIFNGEEGEPDGQQIPGTPVEDEERSITAPFIVDDEVLGAMCLSRIGTVFSTQDLALAEAFAAYASLALKNAQSHDALRQSEEKFSHIFHTSPDSIMVVSLADERYVDVNDSFLRTTGYRREQVIGHTLDEIDIWVDPQDYAKFVHMLQEQGSIRDLESSFRTKLGEVGVVLTSAEIIKLDGEPCLLIISKIITERKQAEQALRRAHDELEQRVEERTEELSNLNALLRRDIDARQRAEWALYKAKEDADQARRAAETANQAKSVFLANMSHELRTPLNAVLGFSELMTHDDNLTLEQRDNLGAINRSGEHLLTLINDVLELSKIEAGRVELQEESFDLYNVLMGLEDMFRLRVERKGLALNFELAPGVPQYVRADGAKLRQVLINLLGNATKFTHAGSVTLRVLSSEYEAGAKEDGVGSRETGSSSLLATPHYTLHFQVRDTGVGIAPDELSAVFDAFVQTVVGQGMQQGTGLGLPISREFVRLMGGELTVTSPCRDELAYSPPLAHRVGGEVGPGSCFSFTVQASLATPSEIKTLKSRVHKRVIGLEPGQPTFRLLIVEDIVTNRELLVKLLFPLGFSVREAVDGQQAIKVWKEWKPHLIWMDMRMPVMDGHEATRRIKAAPQGKDTIIVALTASAFEEERETMLAEGCDGFIRKPIREADIFDALADHLGVRFVYKAIEAEGKRESAKGRDLQELLPAAMTVMDLQWLLDLRQATIEGDLEWIANLTGRFREQDADMADALAELANDFEYEQIRHLIQQAEAL